jgi:hypothetical protein
MRKTGSLVLIIAASVLLGPPVAQAEHELVGFTSATMTGDTGVLGFTLACQAEFGSTARMCDSLEVMRTTNVPSGLSGTAWVRPVFQPMGFGMSSTSSGTVTRSMSMDASGIRATILGDLTCYGWAIAGDDGLTVDANGGFGRTGCPTLQSVACCTPVAEAAVASLPSIVPWGHGLLVALMLSVAGGALLFRGRPLLTSGRQGIVRR